MGMNGGRLFLGKRDMSFRVLRCYPEEVRTYDKHMLRATTNYLTCKGTTF